MTLNMKNKFISLLVLCFMAEANATVTLPKIFTSNMVLQRDKEIKIWGWADNGETVTVSFNGQSLRSKADKLGNWIITLKPMVYGGPYQMTIAGKKDIIRLANILIGILGAFLGSQLLGGYSINTGISIRSILISLVGAVVLLGLINLIRRGRVR